MSYMYNVLHYIISLCTFTGEVKLDPLAKIFSPDCSLFEA